MNHKQIKELLRIRIVEETFLDLFSKGRLNGTVHTCIGQELSSIAFAGQVEKSDFIFSNHRCHGHFISYTGDWRGLIAELMGNKNGVSGGIGSSQHLHKFNFYSNGIQGGITPVAAGFALGNKMKKNNAIGIVFIGDGTLGEGVVYETLNIISKWELPLLVVCENNRYAQSTPIQTTLSGEITARAAAFGITSKVSNTWDSPDEFIESAKASIDTVRNTQKPLFHLVNTYRLKAHSKGDDDRDIAEINDYTTKDCLEKFRLQDPDQYAQYHEKIYQEVQSYVKTFTERVETTFTEYAPSVVEEQLPIELWEANDFSNERIVTLINKTLTDLMTADSSIVVLGEDIVDPYGGAFKVTKGLSTKFPERVYSTPISEAAIVGISNGLALNGIKPFGEIMFGDFLSLTFDQLLNHAAKFHDMYNKQLTCPVVIRTPMGGRRGYGPTHSQSIEKHFIGMPSFEILASNILLNPKYIFEYAAKRIHPTLIIENKIDYAKKQAPPKLKNYQVLKSKSAVPHILVTPLSSTPTLTFITYGGSVEPVMQCLEEIFLRYDLVCQVLCLSMIDPLPLALIKNTVKDSEIILTVEEGTSRGSWGSEVIAGIVEEMRHIHCKRITSLDYAIPSVKSLEDQVLVNRTMILQEIQKLL